ncbi:MAG: LLM class flavin-dependent oxidoreductase [Aquamicrobium sp.]|jgi:FMN-dependent oxidoreductase (nitrilotriacetate monooxygenase family)|uniref:LLM class flavin-dependent oxidoreductase n=1 Tax=Mesorhizobium sp. Pch-S TaxID=2082387 RepID=UPI001010E9CD|nr:LLM class flavin-dependent oxidoreductase [Mesorhizobium sp. Pch-S]MBR2689446.1 LLM class flavin-dependent oxidoreductase [Aquamicrobium sp.]QAZ42017.1 LLM class flavin-dependent oxidoreductase [Mesorhizobium sp. Pch-S]
MAHGHIILSAFFFNPQGDHRMSWRHPRAPGREILDFDYYRDLVQAAERAKIDTIFVADHVSIWDSVKSGVAHYANARLEPLTLLAALAGVTRHIGLITTASSSYSEPYNVARFFASLDHISKGRASWNVVTSAMEEEARNFGRDGNIDHALRYERAGEYLDIVKALWDSWEDEALLIDKETGYFADPAKVHAINHKGPHFRVRGPLNVSRPPQGHPLIVQAGSSEDGKNFATAHADAHFAIFSTREDGVRYRKDINERLARHGRHPESFKILPGILPIVAGSKDEALERQEYLQTLLPDQVGIDLLSSWSGLDLSAYPPDGPVPPLPDESTFNGGHTSLNRVRQWAKQNLTLREVARRLSNSGSVPTVAGTPVEIADQLEDWFVAGAADGFNLMFPLLPEDWHAFAEKVVPELQRRGLFRTEYEPGTLRDRLGLARPANRFAEQRDNTRAVS